MTTTLKISRAHWASMRAHVEAAAPLEGCGLLAGTNDQVEAVFAMRNAAESPTRFRLDPREQLQVFDRLEADGLELLGIFHSHPSGPDALSATDVAEAAYDVVHVVWSPAGREWRARAFRLFEGRVTDVGLEVET